MDTVTLKSKICLVGGLAVGKTSLIRRFTLNVFDDQYRTTLGTKVTKKTIEATFAERGLIARVDMTIWDIMGQQGFQELLKEAYFHGARGILGVADLTRRASLIELGDWIAAVQSVAGYVPVLIAMNKSDLSALAQVNPDHISEFVGRFQSNYLGTSAKTGENVDDAFQKIGRMAAERQIGEGPDGEA